MDRMSPKNNYTGLGSNGWGAWEIGARYSKFNAQDVAVTAGQFVNQAHSYSVGLKWIVDPNTRFLMDYIYTDYQDKFINYNVLGVATAAGSGGTDNEKSVNMRAQFDF
jgi:phosphate-selective porin OprO/OprP